MTTLDAAIFVGLLAIVNRKRRKEVLVDALVISSVFALLDHIF
jgi:hypothetical protein